jgi:hypothetical protein
MRIVDILLIIFSVLSIIITLQQEGSISFEPYFEEYIEEKGEEKSIIINTIKDEKSSKLNELNQIL